MSRGGGAGSFGVVEQLSVVLMGRAASGLGGCVEIFSLQCFHGPAHRRQIHTTQQVLVDENQRRMLDGEKADDVYPEAVRQTHPPTAGSDAPRDLFRRERDA